MADVVRDLRQLLDADRSQVVATIPSQGFVAGVTVAIRESSARALKTLNQSRDVVRRGQLEEQVDMIGHDADFDHTRAVSLGLSEEKGAEKGRYGLIDERHAGPAGPGQMGIDANRHDSNLSGIPRGR